MEVSDVVEGCPVCLETLGEPSLVLTNRCGHSAHRECVHMAVRNGNYTCPLCRTSYADQTNVSSVASKAITDKRLIKYYKMLSMKMPVAAIKQRMEADRIPSLVIDSLLTGGAVHSEWEIGAAVVKHRSDLDAQSKDKYVKMMQVGMDEGAVRQRMLTDGLSQTAVDSFFSFY